MLRFRTLQAHTLQMVLVQPLRLTLLILLVLTESLRLPGHLSTHQMVAIPRLFNFLIHS